MTDASPATGGGAAKGDGGIELPPGTECTNRECTKANGDLAAVCVKEKRQCVPLLTSECPQLEGPHERDDAIVLGVLDDTWSAAVLAALEINDYGPGLPGGVDQGRRPLVLLRCDHDPSNPDRVMDHIIDDLALPGIIPPASSEQVIALSERTVPAGVFMLATGSAAPAITHLSDDGLVWRVAPSQGLAGPAWALSVAGIEAKMREGGFSGALRVAMLAAKTFAAAGVRAEVLSHLRFNGQSALDPANEGNFAIIEYSGIADSDFAAGAESLDAFAPHVVLGIGNGEPIGFALALEAIWNQPAYLPEYVFSGNSRDDFWLPRITPAFAERVRGVYSPDQGAGYPAFKARYELQFGLLPQTRSNHHFAYDATYAIAYAIAAAASQGPITGQSIAHGMSKLVPPGSAIEVGPGADSGNIQGALTRLGAGEGIDLQGISGNLDFDLETGEPSKEATPVQIWCVGSRAGRMQYLDSGQKYDPATDALLGAFECPSSAE